MQRIDRSAWDVIIVGAGAAGIAAAQTLARCAPRSSVLLLSEEDRLPYKRTKISKHIARGFAREQFAQLPPEWYAEQGFGLGLRARVVALDPPEHRVELADGTRLSWDSLILATGADPILPVLPFGPSADLPQHPPLPPAVFVLRTAAQVEALRAALGRAHRVAVIGAGVLGLEVTEQLRLLDREVLLIGRDPQLMARQLNPRAAQDLAEVLRANGVELRLQETVMGLERRPGGGVAVGLVGGEAEADLVVWCVGVRPRSELAARAGLRVDHGILVDRALRTSHPGILAAGDVAQHPDGTVSHLWHAAKHQGELAALSAAGEQIGHENPPFRLKCEVFGQYVFSMGVPAFDLPARGAAREPAAAVSRRAGSSPVDTEDDELEPWEAAEEAAGGMYRCLYFRGGRLSGALMVNDRDRAKLYEAAVREGWSRPRVEKELPPA